MIVEKVLVESAELTTAAVVYYTTSIKVLAVIIQATLCNTTAAAVTATIHLTPPGASPDVTNAIIWQQSIPASKTVDLYPMANHVLTTAGTSIQALASTGTALTFRVSGYERAIT
jgi:hypothetical protein